MNLVAKKKESVTQISVGLYPIYGKSIASSDGFIACTVNKGHDVGVFDINFSGRAEPLFPRLMESDLVTDLDFSPSIANLLATTSKNGTVKLWKIPEDGLTQSTNKPKSTFKSKNSCDLVKFHHLSPNLLTTASREWINFYDLSSENQVFENNNHNEPIQDFDWCGNGAILATQCKDKYVRILDPRSKNPIVKCANSHMNIRDSKVTWLKDEKYIITTGFDKTSCREVFLRDTRKFDIPIASSKFEQASGILIPVYSKDKDKLFLGKKGDVSILQIGRENLSVLSSYSGSQMKDLCFTPSLLLDNNEVVRMLQLTANSIEKISYTTKSRIESHAQAQIEIGASREWMNFEKYFGSPTLSNIPHSTNNRPKFAEPVFDKNEEIEQSNEEPVFDEVEEIRQNNAEPVLEEFESIVQNIYVTSIERVLMEKCQCEPNDQCGNQCLNRATNFECESNVCPCGNQCTNNRIQRRDFPNIEKFNAGEKGWGVRSLEMIKKESLIAEYLGEVRLIDQSKDKNNVYCLKLNSNYIIDAQTKGNITRFVNHSCQPNARMETWCVNGLYRMVLTSKRDIMPAEEITFDYQFESFESAHIQDCKCNSERCRKTIRTIRQNSKVSNARILRPSKKANEKPLVCKTNTSFKCDCGDCFTSQSSLNRHQIRTHNTNRNLVCIDCNKAFLHRDNLIQHGKTHQPTKKKKKKGKKSKKPKCEICATTFTKMTSLNRHQIKCNNEN